MSNLLDLYTKMIKAKQHYQHITTNQNFEIFYEIEQQLFRALDNILLNNNNILNDNIWIINDDKSIKCIKCIYCDYCIVCNDTKLLKYKKIIHQKFNCKS
jgi:hypothetical protein